jgi:hypothetical protein
MEHERLATAVEGIEEIELRRNIRDFLRVLDQVSLLA